MTGVVAATIALAGASADADGDIEPGSAGDTWTSATSKDNGQPLIHSLRTNALSLRNRSRYAWRIGITWRFAHALANGMPGPEDRGQMTAIDDAIHQRFEAHDEQRIVYFTTGGGIREVMLYGTSEAGAWQAIDALAKRFPQELAGDRRRWAYVQRDAGWDEYRAVRAAIVPAEKR